MATARAVEFREEEEGDIPAIRSVHERAFGSRYEPRLVDMLRDADRVVLSLVAVVADQVVGHVCFTSVIVKPPSDSRWVALGPIGVLPEYQGQGIGSQLVREGLRGCRSRCCDGVVLLGAPRFYSRFGLVRADEHGLASEFGDGPAFQAVELRKGALRKTRGVVLFASEFREAEESPQG